MNTKQRMNLTRKLPHLIDLTPSFHTNYNYMLLNLWPNKSKTVSRPAIARLGNETSKT